MRIAFVVCGELEHVSGGFLYDRRLVAGLRAAGDTVDVIALPWRRYGRAVLDNFDAWPFDPGHYDVVVEDELCHPALLWRNRTLRRAGGKVVALVHNLAARQPATRGRWLVRAVETGYLRGVDGAVVVCAATLADVRAFAPRTRATFVAHPGRDHVEPVAPALIAARAQRSGPLRLLSVGVVATHKGVHRLVPVLAGLRAAGVAVTLDVAGARVDRSYAARVERALARAGVADAVTFHGLVDAPTLARLGAGSDVFVMPSDREAYPIAALEALAAGLPVLLTDAGGTAELIGDCEAGRVLPPQHARAWIDALAALASDRGRLAHLGAAAQARWRAHRRWDEVAAGVSTWLKGISAGRG